MVVQETILTSMGVICSYVLLKQYNFTKIKDYLIFSLVFISLIINQIIVLITGIRFASDYDPMYSKSTFLFVQKTLLITGMLSWLYMFIIAYRSKHQKKLSFVSVFMGVYSVVLIVLSLLVEIENLPEKSNLLGLTFYATQDGPAAIFKITDSLIYGQGYEILLLGFRSFSASYFLVKILRLQNPLLYPRFNKVRLLWVISMGLYLCSQLSILVIMFFNLRGAFIFFQLFQSITGLSFIVIVIYAPEGFLLSRVQIIRAKKYMELYSMADKNKDFITSKIVEYIDYIAQDQSSKGK